MGLFRQDRRVFQLILANIFSSVGAGITMIAIPWLLVNQEGGDQLFGYTTLGLTILLFFISPYVGLLVDRFSRKKFLLFSQMFGFSVVSLFFMFSFLQGGLETWQLMVVYISGSMYYTLHFPAQFAFAQEVFNRGQYRMLNSMLEVQNQVSTMVAGGIASLVIGKIEITYLLGLNVLTYAIAFIILSLIPYKMSRESYIIRKVSMIDDFKEGFSYFINRPLFALFLFSAYMPFIGVMVGNYLFPIYIINTLQADASVMGMSDMIYAIGAVIAGLTVPLLMKRIGNVNTIVITTFMFTLSYLIIGWLSFIPLFLGLKIFQGWGNSGSRVARNTIIMEQVPNEIVGRVNSFINAVGLGLRLLLISFFTGTITTTGAAVSVMIVGFILTLSFLAILVSKRSVSQLSIDIQNKAIQKKTI